MKPKREKSGLPFIAAVIITTWLAYNFFGVPAAEAVLIADIIVFIALRKTVWKD